MSLRARLLAGLAAVALVLVSASAIVTATTRRHLLDQVDRRLIVATSNDRGSRFGPPRPGEGSRGPLGPPTAATPERLSDLYEGVLTSDGTLVTFFEPNLPGQNYGAPRLDRPFEELRTGTNLFTAHAADGSVRYRVATRAINERSVVVAAVPLADVEDTVSRLVLVQAVTVALVLAGLGAVAWWVIRLGIHPIKAMTDAAGEIAAGNLNARVPAASARTESGALAAALNAMLGRIEAATGATARSEAKLRQFVADASHELRTPVTTIRGYTELYQSGGLNDRSELDDAMRRTNEEAVRMGRLVEDMLELARLDQERPLNLAAVDLSALAADAARDARAVAPDRAVELDAPAPVIVLGDSDRLRQVVANVVGNAIVHTTPNSPIRIRAYRSDGGQCFEVVDAGPGMTPDQAARMTERFYRADPSRSRARGGSGLGMSIVDAVVDAHGGRIEIDSQPGRGTSVRIVLPAAAPTPAGNGQRTA